jgi:hypothetical protein
MIPLCSVIPQSVLDVAQFTVTLQELLMALTDDSIPSAIEQILSLPFRNSHEGVLTLTNNLLLAIQYRPYHLFSIARLAKSLCDLSAPDNHFGELKQLMLRIPAKIIDEKWRLALIREELALGLYTDDEIFAMITCFLERFPILPNKPFWKNHHRQHIVFLVWFGDLIERKSPDLFATLYGMMATSVSKRELSPSFTAFHREFEDLRANDWEKYKVVTRNVYPLDSLATVLRVDDVDRLTAIADSPGFQIDARIESSVFEYASFLLRQPTLVQFCALYASVRCFDYLVSRGANLTLKDAGKRILLHFAIAGGDQHIINIAASAVNDFVVATRVSAEFHRFELFREFLTTKKTDLKANDIENGSIFHGIAAANHVRMILFCIEQGCDVNLKDGDGVFQQFIGRH